MRILHLGKYYPPYRGGMETVLQNQAEGLLEAGAEVRVLVAGQQNIDSWEFLVSGDPRTGDSLVRAGSWGNFQSQPLIFSFFSLLRQQIAGFKPDIVQLHLPNPLAVAAWYLLGKSQIMPPLSLWHHADITRQKKGAWLLRPLMKYCRQEATGIAVSSRALLENSLELETVREKVQVIPFGIKDPFPESISFPGNAFLFIGRLVPYKGLDLLLEALSKNQQGNLDIVGTGPLKDHLNRKISRLKMGNRIRMHGDLGQVELDELLARCRGLVLPSLDTSETFGLVQLEAMAAGKFILASDLPTGVAEVNRPGQTGLLVPPGDVDSWANALAQCSIDDDLVTSWGKQSRQVFLDEYTRDIMTAKLLAWYETMINLAQ